MIQDTEDIEFRSPEEIREYQNMRLREALAYPEEHSPYYGRMFREHGIDIAEIQSVDDLVRLPFTEKKTYSSTTATSSACRPRR